jgi:hypothetical protein
MNTRERFHAIMNFQPFDRLPLLEWAGWWDKTLARWHQEALPAGLTNRYEICAHFGLDIYLQDGISACRVDCPKPAAHGAGIIEDEAGYERVLPYLYPDECVDLDLWREWAVQQRQGEAVLWFTVAGFFWFARELLGIERHLCAFYEQPHLLKRINQDLAQWMLKVVNRIASVCTPDFMTFAEDMSYNHGPMISHAMFDEFMTPYYDRVVPALLDLGVIPFIDSDGDIGACIPWFKQAGLRGALPLERQAGIDLASLRADHPDFLFIGHFDKMTMLRDAHAMRAEFDRLLSIAAEGGYLISCDHQTPPGVSYQNYQTYLGLFAEYAAKAGNLSCGKV